MHTSPALFAAVLATVQEAILTIDTRGIVLSFNPAAERLLGWKEAQVLGRNVSMLMPDPDRFAHDGYLHRYVSGGAPRIIGTGREVVVLTAAGQRRPVRLEVGEALVNGQRLFVGSLRDLTRERRAERMHAAHFAFSPELVCTLRLNGDLLELNPAWKETLGVPRSTLLGRNLLELCVADDVHVLRAALDALAAGDHAQVFEVRWLHADGRELWFEWCAVALLEEGLVLGSARNVTARRRADQMRAGLVSTVSHELRTPLTSIRGALGLLAGGVVGELPDEALALVGLAQSNSDRLIRMVNELLDLDRMDAGRLNLRRVWFDGRELLREVLAQLGPSANGRELTLASDGDTPPRVWGDRDRIAQVLVNLVGNAVKFSPAGGPVRVSWHVDDAGLRCEVADQGAPVPGDERERIFGRFQRLNDADDRRVEGSGLGLAISRMLIERHGGLIGVRCPPEGGNVFWFTLPAPQDDPTQE